MSDEPIYPILTGERCPRCLSPIVIRSARDEAVCANWFCELQRFQASQKADEKQAEQPA